MRTTRGPSISFFLHLLVLLISFSHRRIPHVAVNRTELTSFLLMDSKTGKRCRSALPWIAITARMWVNECRGIWLQPPVCWFVDFARTATCLRCVICDGVEWTLNDSVIHYILTLLLTLGGLRLLAGVDVAVFWSMSTCIAEDPTASIIRSTRLCGGRNISVIVNTGVTQYVARQEPKFGTSLKGRLARWRCGGYY